jgi:glucose-1-phosphate cytidylyltransferase
MVEIGGHPILWHIMNIYAAHGVTDFIVCLGYKGYVIKEYFANYLLHRSDFTIDIAKREISYHNEPVSEPWRITLVDTGHDTLTGGRLKRVGAYLDKDEDFCLTYGDGVADIDIKSLVEYHRSKKVLATLTAVRPPGRYGATTIKGGLVTDFMEKPAGDGGYINGGFFVLNSRVLDWIEGDQTSWETGPLQNLARDRQLAAYSHDGFWHAMDTLRDKNYLESLWQSGRAPWKIRD